MYGHIRNDKIKNEVIYYGVKVGPTENKMYEMQLRWFCEKKTTKGSCEEMDGMTQVFKKEARRRTIKTCWEMWKRVVFEQQSLPMLLNCQQ